MNQEPNDELVSVLIIESADGEEHIIKLDPKESTTFGRSQGDIVINDSEISSTHCKIVYVAGHYHILDSQSTNGTYVNNDRIIKNKLFHNDIITIGKSSMRYQTVQAADLSTDPDSDLSTPHEESQLNQQHHDMGCQIKMNVIYHDGSLETLVFDGSQQLIIGRDSPFGRFNQDDQLSRSHAKIYIHDDGYILIEDQNSTNGVFVNSNKVEGSYTLKDSDVVILGNTYIQLSLTDEQHSTSSSS